MTSVPPAVSDGASVPAVGTTTEPSDTWPPPTPASVSTARASNQWQPTVRAGQLNTLWRSLLAVCWVGVFFAFAAVWKASEEIGIATWWLGPRSDPQPLLIRLAPFIIAIAVGLIVVSNRREAVWVSYGGAALIGVLAVLDVSRSAGLAVIEFAVAGAVILVTTASFAGRYRVVERSTRPADSDDAPDVNR